MGSMHQGIGSHPLRRCAHSQWRPFSSSSSSRRTCWRAHAFVLKPHVGDAIQVDKAEWLIGSGTSTDLRVQGPDVAAEHVELTQKGKQVMCRALVGESMFDSSSTFVDGDELRPNVAYVLASGAKLAIGSDQGVSFTLEFEEGSGSNALLEMMMQGMASGASADVKQALEGKQ